jgi:CHAT domain-containing protein/Tfp pilus assembly protein PilF
MFQHGELASSQETAARLADRYQTVSPGWSAKFRILEAQSASWRGLNQEVLRTLSPGLPVSAGTDLRIQRFSLLGTANTRLHRYDDAEKNVASAQYLCSATLREVCSLLFDARAGLAIERGQFDQAFDFYTQELALARRFSQPFDEATALTNLAVACLRKERFDEAIDFLDASNRIAQTLGAEDILLANIGNLGWAHYQLGDRDRALALYMDAERRATRLGDTEDAINWLTTSGYVYQDFKDWPRAEDSYRQALHLARNINSSEEVIDSLEDLTHVSIDAGNIADADSYLQQLDPLIRANGNRLDALDVMLARGRIAAARRQDEQAEALFRQVEADPASQITMRLGAEHEIARLYEAQGRIDDAKNMYATALGTFESARAQIKNEDSKLPYFANATPIYDDYIRLLVTQGKAEEALAAADQSRARTLAQGLGLIADRQSFQPVSIHPNAIASRADATLLFYWLGEKQSWLWAITPRKTTVFPLPPKAGITRIVERYRQALLGPEDPLTSANEDGRALYRILVAPAKDLLPPGAKVVILCDGVLSELNFETLLAGAPTPHYWIEDADIVSAPSLYMLASAKPERKAGRTLLLLGDAVSPGPDYPELPNASIEMQQIRKHFRPQDETVFARQQANVGSYVHSAPQRFSYIDFVAHGVASRTDPLDSAIILSRTSGADDSFKLYARDIMLHPIDARLVTIAACYGGGTRSYAGEGLVGLSWAFLRAGAHNVIGALWEVSDESAPRLMDALYQGLEDGLPPSAGLRQAKLSMLHSPSGFRRPFFWAPFQLYTGP